MNDILFLEVMGILAVPVTGFLLLIPKQIDWQVKREINRSDNYE